MENILKCHKIYSVSKMEGIHGHGLRPIFIDFLEIGAYKSEDYERSLKYDLSNYKDPTIFIKNYFYILVL